MKRAFPFKIYRKKYKWYATENDRLSKLNEKGYKIKEYSKQPIDNETQFYRQYTHGGGGVPYIYGEEKPYDQLQDLNREIDLISEDVHKISLEGPDGSASTMSARRPRGGDDDSGGSAVARRLGRQDRKRSSSVSGIRIKPYGPLDRMFAEKSRRVSQLTRSVRKSTDSINKRIEEFSSQFGDIDERMNVVESGIKDVRSDISRVERRVKSTAFLGKKYTDKKIKEINNKIFDSTYALNKLVDDKYKDMLKKVSDMQLIVNGYDKSVETQLKNANLVFQGIVDQFKRDNVKDRKDIDELIKDVANIRDIDLKNLREKLSKAKKVREKDYNNLIKYVEDYQNDLFNLDTPNTENPHRGTVRDLQNRLFTINNVLEGLLKGYDETDSSDLKNSVIKYRKFIDSMNTKLNMLFDENEVMKEDQDAFKKKVEKDFKTYQGYYENLSNRLGTVEALTQPGNIFSKFIEGLVQQYNNVTHSNDMNEELDFNDVRNVLLDVIYDTRTNRVDKSISEINNALSIFSKYTFNNVSRIEGLESFSNNLLEESRKNHMSVIEYLKGLSGNVQNNMNNIAGLLEYKKEVGNTLGKVFWDIQKLLGEQIRFQRATQEDFNSFKQFVDFVNQKFQRNEQRFLQTEAIANKFTAAQSEINSRLNEFKTKYGPNAQRDGSSNLINMENYVNLILPEDALNNIAKLNVVAGVPFEEFNNLISMYDTVLKDPKPDDVRVLQEKVGKMKEQYATLAQRGGRLITDNSDVELVNNIINGLSSNSNRLRITRKYRIGNERERIPVGANVRPMTQEEMRQVQQNDGAVLRQMQRMGTNEVIIQGMDRQIGGSQSAFEPIRNNASFRIEGGIQLPRVTAPENRGRINAPPQRQQISQFANDTQGTSGDQSRRIYPELIDEERRRRNINIDGQEPHFNETH